MSSKKKDNFYLDYISKIHNVLNSIELNKIEKFEKLVDKSRKNKILIFGNGAGASIASHFANDLSNTAKIKTLSFDNSAHLTCFANDYGYENWVKKALTFYADKGDLIILISTSGNSKNMINAAKYCRSNKINLVTFTGFKKDNPLSKMGKINFWVDSKKYNIVEMTHHIWILMAVDYLNK